MTRLSVRAVRNGSRPYCKLLQVAALIAALPTSALTISAASSQDLLDDGWWVIVANFPQDETPVQIGRDRDTVLARLTPCGFKPFNDFSMKFSTFRPGFTVFVLGAFPTRGAAEHVKAAVGSCAPTAYVRAAKYAGE